MLRLVFPSIKYQESFVKAIQEYVDAKELYKKEAVQLIKKAGDKASFNRKKVLENKPVSCHYWLVDGKNYIGRINIRHKLNKTEQRESGHIGYAIRPSKRNLGHGANILRLGLLKAKKLGIREVLVICDKNNIGSIKIIEANGGVLINEIKIKNQKIPILRFRIKL